MKKIRFIVSTFLLMPVVAFAQTSSVDVIRQCGENLKTTAYNHFFVTSNIDMTTFKKSEFCREYDSQKSNGTSANASIPYKGIVVGGGFSSSHAKAVYEMECKSDTTTGSISDDFINAVDLVSPDAISAYKVCVAGNKQNVRVKLSPFNPYRLGLDVRNYTFSEIDFKRIDILGEENTTCVGSLTEDNVNGSVVVPGGTLSMVCSREEAQDGSIPEITMVMEVEGSDTWNYIWPGRKACGTKNQPSCSNTTLLERRGKYAEEEAKGRYERSGIIQASAREKQLDTIVRADIPQICTLDEQVEIKNNLRDKFSNDWGMVRLSSTRGHSCTKGSSDGKTKDCKCKRTSVAPNGFENGEISTTGKGYQRRYVGTQAQICLQKSGKGRLEGTVTANWNLTSNEVDRRISEDIAYVTAKSSCFNECTAGLVADKNGICR